MPCSEYAAAERRSAHPQTSLLVQLQVAAGSADQFVYIWRVGTRGIDYKLPGHRGSVNEAVFHPKEPIIASASSDKGIYLGELSKWS